MMVYWAHIDNEGRIATWGASSQSDVFLQPIQPGLTAVARPEDVNGYGGWIYSDGQWTQPNSENSV